MLGCAEVLQVRKYIDLNLICKQMPENKRFRLRFLKNFRQDLFACASIPRMLWVPICP